jgi:hypothetical protein
VADIEKRVIELEEQCWTPTEKNGMMIQTKMRAKSLMSCGDLQRRTCSVVLVYIFSLCWKGWLRMFTEAVIYEAASDEGHLQPDQKRS